jgi:hypothetical protein
VFDIVVHKNVRLSEIIVSDILDSDHITILFHILDHFRTRNSSDPVDKFLDLECLLASELIPPRIQIDSREEVGKAACNFTESLTSVYMISTGEITHLHLNNDVPG